MEEEKEDVIEVTDLAAERAGALDAFYNGNGELPFLSVANEISAFELLVRACEAEAEARACPAALLEREAGSSESAGLKEVLLQIAVVSAQMDEPVEFVHKMECLALERYQKVGEKKIKTLKRSIR